MSTTTVPKRKRGVQRGQSALILFSHRSPAGLATFFLVSFQVVFWFASYFSGYLSGRFLVTCRWFSASILSGNCRHLLQYWCVRKGSHTSFRAMTSNQDTPDQWMESTTYRSTPRQDGGTTMEQYDETILQPQLWTIDQVGKALNLGRTKIYELIWKENLPVQKFGRAVRVSPVELQRWLEERARQ